MALGIKANDSILFYLSCIICEELNELERVVYREIVLRDILLYSPRFQYLLILRDKLIESLFSHLPEIQIEN